MASWRDWTAVDSAWAAPDAPAAHSIHSYFTCCPESPDGTRLLYLQSRAADGESGDLVWRDRLSGETRTVAAGLALEDAHRVACQQWAASGDAIAWHCHVDGRWQVWAAAGDGSGARQIAADRQLGFGGAGLDEVPIYGPHWDPTACRDLEMVNVKTGTTRVVLRAARLWEEMGDHLTESFGAGAPVSIFFPVLSPDGQRVYFKLACPNGGAYDGQPWRGKVSKRETLCCYDLQAQRLLWRDPFWGHPNWNADGSLIVNVPNVIIDAVDGRVTPLTGVPKFPGSHPTWHPDGLSYITDAQLTRFGFGPYWWGLILVRADGAGYRRLHTFYNEGGATSWRIPHPHPIFSHDGQRLYANINDGPWTRLAVLTPRQG